MTARERRLMSDYNQVKKDFAGHKNIIVTSVGDEPPEKYNVTYFVNGIYLLPDGRIETLGRHEVEITLHAEYPRYKPICKIKTPIWHPNFRDGQICIGDIWGAGESLSDIIINIGDMIQYKSWNSYSPLSSEAAQWAIENKHLFPVGNVELNVADYASAKDTVEIDLFDDNGNSVADDVPSDSAEQTPAENPAPEQPAAEQPAAEQPAAEQPQPWSVEPVDKDVNDFEITAEELEGVEFIPHAQRMQSMSPNAVVKGGKINFKTILFKGLLWAIIGAIVGFGISEFFNSDSTSPTVARMLGYKNMGDYLEYKNKADAEWEKINNKFRAWCDKNNKDYDSETDFAEWFEEEQSSVEDIYNEYSKYDEKATEAMKKSYEDDFHYDLNSESDLEEYKEKIQDVNRTILCFSTAIWSAIIAMFIGMFLGIGEGVFYGSKNKILTYGAIGAGVSLALGFASGYLAQLMYSSMLSDDPSDFVAALVRGLGWAVMGIGIGLSVGLIKPEKKRIIFCAIGGLAGGFFGGFLFNYICDIIPNDIVARGVGIILMGILIGVGVGLLEQFAKQAWLKVIRGEFEGKEYLLFAGTTSIGNNGKNTIVLFKDKLVGPHHCDIILEGSKYTLVDCGTPMGTIVNGMKTKRHVLRQGDAISIGNSVLVFNTK